MKPAAWPVGLLLAAVSISLCFAGPNDSQRDSMPTDYIDSTHPAIVEATKAATAGASTERAKAVRIHDFVRDRIRFGWAPAFYDQKASAVLRAGVGFCNTKSTLFVAMLRAAGIPARPHFVNIHRGIISDFIDPGTEHVDHSFTEVQIEGRWLRVDSYIVDQALAEKARARLRRENRPLGFGVHVHGTSTWDGTGDAFAQFVDDGTVPNLTTRDHGVFADVGSFYASGLGVNKPNLAIRLLFGAFARRANAKIEALRRGEME